MCGTAADDPSMIDDFTPSTPTRPRTLVYSGDAPDPQRYSLAAVAIADMLNDAEAAERRATSPVEVYATRKVTRALREARNRVLAL